MRSEFSEFEDGSADVETTLRGACDALLRNNADDGHFAGDLNQGSGPTAQTLILERYLKVLDPEEAQAALRVLSEAIRSDGGIAAYPGAELSSLAETGLVLGAFAAAGVEEGDPRRR